MTSVRVYNDPYNKKRHVREAGLGMTAVRPRASATPSMVLSYQDAVKPRVTTQHPVQNLTRAGDVRAHTTSTPLVQRRTSYTTIEVPEEDDFYAEDEYENTLQPYRLGKNELMSDDGVYYRIRTPFYRFIKAMFYMSIGVFLGTFVGFMLALSLR